MKGTQQPKTTHAGPITTGYAPRAMNFSAMTWNGWMSPPKIQTDTTIPHKKGLDDRVHMFYLCSMIIHGIPLSIPYSGGTETEPRFWYWHGASGRRYIHSVYRPETCPPLPGAVFLAVRSLGNLRTVLGAGRFA